MLDNPAGGCYAERVRKKRGRCMMMDVYVVRHGESEANLAQVHSGWAQINLTEQGRQDAAMAGRLLKGISFDRIYSSDLIRTVQTAQIAVPGCEPVRLECLRETNTGTLTLVSVKECIEKYGEAYLKARGSRDFTAYEGENHAMHRERVAGFLKMLAKTAGDDEKVAVFAHYGTIQCMLDCVTGSDTSHGGVMVNNGSVMHLRWNGTKWILITWNRTEGI